MAFGWWVDKHHRHHAHPNQESLDPDIGGVNLVYTSSQAGGRRGLGRLIARHQGAPFFPMLLLLAVDLRVSGVKAIARVGYRDRVPEALLLGLHLAAYFTAVLLVLSPLKALVFVVVHQGLLGLYLGSVFAPNHKGMPILSRHDDSDFLRRQVLTARNVRGGRLTGLVLGGLNYQIEHHLFPNMPRPSLRRAQPVVRAYCLGHGLPYVETSLIDSYRQALHHLDSVVAATSQMDRWRRPTAASPHPVHSTPTSDPRTWLPGTVIADARRVSYATSPTRIPDHEAVIACLRS